MSSLLHPFVKWGQSEKFVFLKIDVQDIEQQPKIDLEEDGLYFKAHGVGMAGKNSYECNIDFFGSIDPKKSSYRVGGRYIDFHLVKSEPDHMWPRLMEDKVRPAWLKIDFDHFKFEESEPEVDEEGEMNMDMKKFMEELEQERKEQYPVDFKMIYLVMYNLFQFIGYTIITGKLLFYLAYQGTGTRKQAFRLVGEHVACVLITSVLEIVHPLFGWVRTDVFTVLIQVFGRNMVFFGLISAEAKLQDKDAVMYLFLSWSLIELIRYPFYVLQTVKKEVRFLTWLRYTVWVILYPAGFLFEGLIMLIALPHFDRSEKFSLSLPNALNFAFYFPYFLRFYMIAFMPGMCVLMKRMYEQRKKKLGIKTKLKTN